jgi:hypothetical protein
MNRADQIKNLEESIEERSAQTFDAACVKSKSNLGKNSRSYTFDYPAFSSETLLKDIPLRSPKLIALLAKIKELDQTDMKKHGKVFKHFIFSDLKTGTVGTKLIASTLIADGYNLGYSAKLKDKYRHLMNKKDSITSDNSDSDSESESEDEDESESESESDDDDERTPLNVVSLRKLKKKGGAKKNDAKKNDAKKNDAKSQGEKPKNIYEKVAFLSNTDLAKTKNKNFYLLCSSGVYDQSVTVAMKKEILRRFNERPDNNYGENIRFIIMDSGYKEGIDLFDIKYIHIFEPAPIMADQKQIIGRGTRTCGQKGLEFHPTRGWPLKVFIYDLEIPEILQQGLAGSKTGLELYLKAIDLDIRLLNFTHELEKVSVFGSVDYELNRNVHLFSIPDEDGEEELPEGAEFVYGGAASKRRTLRLRKDLPPLVVNTPVGMEILLADGTSHTIGAEPEPMDFEETREYIRRNFSQYEWDPVKMENLCVEQRGGGKVLQYTPTQDFVRHYFTPENPLKGMLFMHSVGTGKCHAKDTPILMYNGSVKMVQDIIEGDELMGDDSTPRKVLSLARGEDEMYDIVPTKGDKYTVNSEHILCLKPTRLGVAVIKNASSVKYSARYINNQTGKINSKYFSIKEEAEQYLDKIHNDKNYILEIPLNEYLKLSKCSTLNLKGYRAGVSFPRQNIDFDPYIIGYWLGDGSKRDPVISTQDAQVIKYLYDELPKHNLCLNYQSGYDYRISSSIPRGENKLLKCLQKYNLINNKHIPDEYKINDRHVQLSLLAGLIDSDGSKDNKGYDIVQKNLTLAEDIVFICRSLGFSAYIKSCEKSCMYKGEKKTGTYYRISISGNEVCEIPVKIERKKVEPRTQKKDVLVTAIEVKHIGRGDYYGFTLSGNNRYLLGDFTVTHNTCSAIAAATTTFEKQGYTILWVTRTTLKADIWKNMFEQVCNESIREQIVDNDLQIPTDAKKRMKLVSKAWRIRPMSYKQFSNLVAKQNAFYHTLVKINGPEDPLRKTLVIIDEAHKLYGGDLSAIEQPDMPAFHRALMNSYIVSGKQSAKLLLMTATPITKSPMEMIQLLNLCKKPDGQFPVNFELFRELYLDDEGKFSVKGEKKYLNDIAGYISYLNREKDARQFSQPELYKVPVPIVPDIKLIETFDKRAVKQFMETDRVKLMEELKEKIEKLKFEPKAIAKDFAYLKEKCDDEDVPAIRAQCKKIVNANIKELVREAKGEMAEMKETVKNIRTLIKERNQFRKSAFKDIAGNRKNNEELYNDYKNSLYYQLKSKCGKTVKGTTAFKEEVFANDEEILEWSKLIEAYNEQIRELQGSLKADTESYKNRVLRIKKLLKSNLSELERSVVNSVLKDVRKTARVESRQKGKQVRNETMALKKQVKITQKAREKKYIKLRKTLKKRIMDEKKELRKAIVEEKKEKKQLEKENGRVVLLNERLRNLADTYSEKIDREIAEARGEVVQAQQEKADNKQREKDAKLQQKVQEKEAKLAEKIREKEEKAREKQVEKEEKARAKEQERATRKAQKDSEKAAKKGTMKNKK